MNLHTYVRKQYRRYPRCSRGRISDRGHRRLLVAADQQVLATAAQLSPVANAAAATVVATVVATAMAVTAVATAVVATTTTVLSHP